VQVNPALRINFFCPFLMREKFVVPPSGGSCEIIRLIREESPPEGGTTNFGCPLEGGTTNFVIC